MTITQVDSGSQTCTISTEFTLNTFEDPITTDGVYQLYLDLSALVNGDILEVRVYEKSRSGDTARVMSDGYAVFSHAQVGAGVTSPPFIIMHGAKFTLKQTDGTARAVLWSIRRIT